MQIEPLPDTVRVLVLTREDQIRTQDLLFHYGYVWYQDTVPKYYEPPRGLDNHLGNTRDIFITSIQIVRLLRTDM